jgi:hypothetical protein
VRTILISGLSPDTAAESLCALLRNIPQPAAITTTRSPDGLSSARLVFDTPAEARDALRVIDRRREPAVTVRLAVPEAELETA